MRRRCFLLMLAPLVLAAQPNQSHDDAILRAMKDEIARAQTLSIASLDNPYHIEYALEDVNSFVTSAALGALITTNQARFRVPRVSVRVGDYKFDNTNYVFSQFFSGSRFDPERFPLDNDYFALRRAFWLATDRSFKTAVEAIARKRAALKNLTQAEELPDFWKAQPVQKIGPVRPWSPDTRNWPERVKSLSEVFLGYPEVLSSSVQFSASRSIYHFHNSEGSTVRRADPIIHLQVQASAQTDDGSNVRDSFSLPRPDENSLPDQAELRKLVTEVADNVRALVKAPVADSYIGPVLFEGIAGAQVFAELLAPNLVLPRRPVAEPGRQVRFAPSELEGRIDSRILPEFLDVIDDPTASEWKGSKLLGSYAVDEEGVVPKAVTVIDDGRLKSFLLTRQPVKGAEASNGRARLPGIYGARNASVSNLVVRSSEEMKPSDLRKKLIEMVQARNKPYGIIVRKMDFPSSAPADEVRRIMVAAGQSGSVRPVSTPILIYRVFPDGREELVRGLRFRAFTVRSLRDIVAVSNEASVLHYLNNMAPLALLGAGSYVAPVSVIAPSLLFDDLELERPQDNKPTLPLVPPPPLTSSVPSSGVQASR